MADLKYPSAAAVPLRQLAATFNFTVTRGIGAGEVGNIGALMVAIAEAYNDDPESVKDLVGQILDKRESVREVVEMIKRDGAIIL